MLRSVVGDESAKQLIGVFLKDTPDRIERIDRAVRSKDMGEVDAAAHKLEGACAYFGSDGMLELCASLRRMTKGSQQGDVARSVTQLRREFEHVRSFLRNELDLA